MVENQVRRLVHVRHDGDDEFRFLFQRAYPRVQVGGGVVGHFGVKAHGVADHGSREFGHQLLLGVLRVAEASARFTVEPFGCHGGVRHLVQHGGIILHAAPVSLLRRAADVELRLHGHHDTVLRGRVESPVHTFVRLYRAEPLLRLHHAVEGGMGVHSLRVPEFGHLEPVKEFLHPFRLHLGQVGLRHVIDREGLDERDGLQPLPFLLRHGTVLVGADAPAVPVLYQHVPVHHGEGFLAFQDMGFQVMGLLEGQIDRELIPHGGRVQLQEERVGAGIVASSHVLRQPGIARLAAYPAFLPAGFLHLPHTLDHHCRKPFQSCLAGTAR